MSIEFKPDLVHLTPDGGWALPYYRRGGASVAAGQEEIAVLHEHMAEMWRRAVGTVPATGLTVPDIRERCDDIEPFVCALARS